MISEDEHFALAFRAPDADDYSDANDPCLGNVIFNKGAKDKAVWAASLPESCEAFSDELEAWEWLFDETGQDAPEGCEALEHWLVTDWMATQLRREGESVVELEGLNLIVWARCTSGQAVYADGVMQRIAKRRQRA
jgi:hypothetical protein